ncbi:isoaspartyl peptidase/L-asparaginase family protein [Rouxiella badensis]|jgi:beta-aspartyl-peptidase (threonine type)|uniref:Isoaspartyl peptidase n=1 Tax=Rouxiella badensis TaxID=1646377 RepID=A0A1X0WEY0_9GAMM|nr:isoaspartyl peptidase/L-asparaginase [Rouxiella badensis]MCC3703801.1 isoaspartyl peptidase/L-asparaginase [Rouxiella badensis]MCC3719829.1 isoaspartyl peptidase/L-asparaginase [Rouxiella badensis]MCC3729319.1 isoaspartyl peptidase/L-asparaginase [Rouxiella badensis]MCC3734735.1 isoaspartyl peptidase/L-asparaginase [Rouxiella badensis]MCC3741486.1 isoaspartyl peptidase/L-asparaginase [Rouxiella badensis]
MNEKNPPLSLALHGGCGVMAEEDMTPQEWEEARDHLKQALRAGWKILQRGGSALDAVQATVLVMEDSVYFNAGYGAALNADAEHELDAAIMDGATLAAGAVCGARHIRNPVLAARSLLDAGESVLLSGAGADAYAEQKGLACVDSDYFTTPRRVEALAAMRRHQIAGTYKAARESEKHGTVGAVALDVNGHLAAATSTGGYTNKPVGRIGDSPLIGSGTYARDSVCAISGTGQGEYFIRNVMAYDIAARMIYAGESLQSASAHLVMGEFRDLGVGAGVIAIDANGKVSAPYNTLGMFRAWVTEEGRAVVASHHQLYEFTL